MWVYEWQRPERHTRPGNSLGEQQRLRRQVTEVCGMLCVEMSGSLLDCGVLLSIYLLSIVI